MDKANRKRTLLKFQSCSCLRCLNAHFIGIVVPLTVLDVQLRSSSLLKFEKPSRHLYASSSLATLLFISALFWSLRDLCFNRERNLELPNLTIALVLPTTTKAYLIKLPVFSLIDVPYVDTEGPWVHFSLLLYWKPQRAASIVSQTDSASSVLNFSGLKHLEVGAKSLKRSKIWPWQYMYCELCRY